MNAEPVIPFVDRDQELKIIRELIEEAISGRTSALLVKGDVGIGKTRLMEKTLEIAKGKNFQIGVGHGVKGVRIPFVTLTECFSELGIEHLLSPQKPPRVDCIYLSTNKGILIAKVERENFQIKPEIFTAMLALVNRFVQDSMKLIDPGSAGGLGRLEYEGWWIVVERLGELNLVAILSGRETEFLIEDMRNALFNIQKKYGKVLKNWNGDADQVAGIEEEFRHIITSGKYDGIDYGKGDFAAQRTSLFENVTRGVCRLAAEKPMLLVIENIHWADESTISMVSYLIQNLRNSNLFVLLTARTDELAESFANDVLGELVNSGKMQEIELLEIPREGAVEILEAIAKGIGKHEEVVNEILSETGGNPLFLIEITRYMIAVHEMVQEGDVWKIVKKREHRIPKKVEEIFRRKLAGLGEMREIVECGSVIGESFNPDIVAAVFGIDRFQMLRKLRNIENYGLITFAGNDCAFVHTLAREVTYQSIPQPVRLMYHEKVAESMERIYKGKIEENLSRIGYHYYRAGNPGKALPYLLKGIRNAEIKFANEEALQLIGYAKELCENDESLKEVHIALLEKEGDLYQITGKYRNALAVYSSLLQLTSAPERIYRKMGECAHATGDYDEGLEYVKRGLENADKANREYGRLRLLEGTIHYRKGEIEEAQQIYLEILSVFEEFGAEEKDRALLLNNLGNVYFEKRELKKALDYYRMSLAIREKINEHLAIAGSYNNIGIVYRYMHEYSTALAYFQKSLRQAEKCGHLWGMIFPLDNMADLYFAVGDVVKCVQTYRTEILYLKKIENLHALINTYGKLAKVYAKHEKFDEAMECLVESGGYVLKTDNPLLLAGHFLAHVAVYREQGKLERALEFVDRALVELKKVRNDERGKILLLNALSDKGDLLYLLGRKSEAEKICTAIFNTFSTMDVAKAAGYAYITSGKILAEQGKIGEARSKFIQGVEALKLYGGEYRTACAYLAWGMVEKEAGNKEEAAKLVDRAIKMFTMMKMKRKIEEAKKIFES
ncbi:MAG: tetratricopeptide repeat protein [Thermoplasmata archaeon]|nr:tetratricopeptide repeat protein [Thermoplasmata archaeon]